MNATEARSRVPGIGPQPAKEYPLHDLSCKLCKRAVPVRAIGTTPEEREQLRVCERCENNVTRNRAGSR